MTAQFNLGANHILCITERQQLMPLFGPGMTQLRFLVIQLYKAMVVKNCWKKNKAKTFKVTALQLSKVLDSKIRLTTFTKFFVFQDSFISDCYIVLLPKFTFTDKSKAGYNNEKASRKAKFTNNCNRSFFTLTDTPYKYPYSVSESPDYKPWSTK